MAKYRIRVEALDANEKLEEELINGIECEGYFLSADKKSGSVLSIMGMSGLDMAFAILKSTELLNAAIIAKAMYEGKQMVQERKKPKEIKVDMTRLFGKLAGGD